MTTDYDAIAEEYRQAKQQPWRTFVEAPSLMGLLGDLSGRRVVDLACGEGYYTRKVAAVGASRVVGVDLSPGMIELARAQEQNQPLGIEYVVSDARDLAGQGEFDIVVAAYLLNYARTRDELAAMAAAICRCLRPGGRFVTVNSNPALFTDGNGDYAKYGFTTRLGDGAVEGTPVTWSFHLAQESISVENYYLSVATHEAVLSEQGLSRPRWRAPQVATAGASEHEPGYWDELLRRPPMILLECTKL